MGGAYLALRHALQDYQSGICRLSSMSITGQRLAPLAGFRGDGVDPAES